VKTTKLTVQDLSVIAGLRSATFGDYALRRETINADDDIDYRAMRSCAEAMKCSLPATRVNIETNQGASPHDVAEYLMSSGQ
jgi:hypothetical protein